LAKTGAIDTQKFTRLRSSTKLRADQRCAILVSPGAVFLYPRSSDYHSFALSNVRKWRPEQLAGADGVLCSERNFLEETESLN
jgi:hypothetical protein